MALPWQPLIVLLLINTASAQSRSAKADTPLVWQPWMVGFTAVIVFLFIVFVAMIAKKILQGKNKDTDDSCLGLNTEERNKDTDDSCLGLNTEERSKKTGDSSRDLTIEERTSDSEESEGISNPMDMDKMSNL